MKLWFGYSSEHSSNLVMIGRFKDPADASKAHQIIERITDQVLAEDREGTMMIGGGTDRYPKGMLELLSEVNVFSISPAELEQFVYDVTVKLKDETVELTTDEIDVSAFLKVLIDKGARVEVYSAHNYPETGKGRGE
jgi:hypothetical protein